jgi:dienelactone hydrolase
MRRAGRRLLGLLLLAMASCAAEAPVALTAPGPLGRAEGPWAQQSHAVPVAGPGGPRLILARLCRPPGDAPRRLAVLNHGKPVSTAEIEAFALPSCEAEQVRWFLERGFAVILPLRRGYGASGGTVAERNPTCAPSRNYVPSAMETARDIRAAIDYATTLPGILPDKVVVVGQSAGGLGTVALASLNDRRIAALASMAGGDGGHLNRVPGAVCQPQALEAAMARFGATAKAPMLWVYTANDSYFAPDLAAAMHRAFTAAGGRAELAALRGWGRDGHILFTGRGGSVVWGPLMERFLGLAPRQAAASALARP